MSGGNLRDEREQEVETEVIIMVPESDARLRSRRQNEKGRTAVWRNDVSLQKYK